MTEPTNGAPQPPVYQWAPPAPVARKRHTGLWAGGIAVAAVVGLVAASLVLIAPGTAIAGVPVGGLTAGAAADAVDAQLARTSVVLTGAGNDAVVTGAELGARVDAKSLAAAVFAQRPMWNPGAWFAGASEAQVTLDRAAATAALREAAPSLYRDPVDATVTYDAATQKYAVTPAVAGTGIDVDAVATALHDAFAKGESTVDVAASAVPVTADTPDYVAQGAADMLNGMLDKAGFYVGSERTVPIPRATLASWLTVTTDDRGAVRVSADAAAIQAAVDTLAGQVDRKAVAATVITNTSGKVLKTATKGVTGRTLGDTSGIAAAFAAQLADGDAAYVLPVTIEKPATTALARSIEVDLSKQRAYLYENGKVVHSYLVSTGRSGHATHTGTFKIFAKVRIQNMGCFEGAEYCTKDVPYVSYFNGDQALHGTWWHHNFGHVMSHGCVNMPIDVAKFVYTWAPIGTTVWVHY